MTVLRFPLPLVCKLFEHAKAAPGHKLTIGERLEIYGEPKGWAVQPDEEKHGKPGLWLVKDEGIYLMSNGSPGLPREGAKTDERGHTPQEMCYAEGFDPNKEDPGDVWDKATEAVGGDDFVDLLPAEIVEQAIKLGGDVMALRVTEDSFELLTIRG